MVLHVIPVILMHLVRLLLNSPLFFLFTVPMTMTILNIYITPIRKVIERTLGVKADKEDLTFKKVFTTKKGSTIFWLIYLIWVLLAQVFIGPLMYPLNKPSIRLGKWTHIGIRDMPSYFFTTVMHLILPIFIANKFYYSFKELCNCTKEASLIRNIGYLIGFLFALFLIEKITIFDVIVVFTLYLSLTKTSAMDNIYKSIGVKQEDIQKDGQQKLFVTGLTLLMITLFVLTFGNFAPGYSFINGYARSFSGVDGVTGIVNYGFKFLLFLMLPFAILSSLNSTVTDDAKSEDFSNIGWTIGILTALIINGFLPPRFRPLNALNKVAGKADAVIGQVTSAIPGGIPSRKGKGKGKGRPAGKRSTGSRKSTGSKRTTGTRKSTGSKPVSPPKSGSKPTSPGKTGTKPASPGKTGSKPTSPGKQQGTKPTSPGKTGSKPASPGKQQGTKPASPGKDGKGKGKDKLSAEKMEKLQQYAELAQQYAPQQQPVDPNAVQQQVPQQQPVDPNAVQQQVPQLPPVQATPNVSVPVQQPALVSY